MEEVEERVEGETIRQPSQFNKNLDQGENGHQKTKAVWMYNHYETVGMWNGNKMVNGR